ncbi:MAG: class I SAM-dependent methyltransferase [Thermoflexales bacterium]|nr:class I SAM-dependent methyltransferase [Thermoflexales bacterium]
MKPVTQNRALSTRRDRNYLDAFLESYWFAPPVALWRSIEAKALSEIDFPGPMLDFGCGDGMFTEAIFGKQPGVYGCDIAVAELPSARSSGVYTEGVEFADGHALPYETGAFGSVYSNSVVEHIPDPENVLPELARVLRPGGKLVLTVPSDQFRSLLSGVRKAPNAEAAKAYSDMIDKRFAHHHYHSPAEWAALFEKVGVTLSLARYYISPAAMTLWDDMNAEFGIGQRTLLSTLMAPRLRWLGVGPSMTRSRLAARLPDMRARYADPYGEQGGGLLVVGTRNG